MSTTYEQLVVKKMSLAKADAQARARAVRYTTTAAIFLFAEQKGGADKAGLEPNGANVEVWLERILKTPSDKALFDSCFQKAIRLVRKDALRQDRRAHPSKWVFRALLAGMISAFFVACAIGAFRGTLLPQVESIAWQQGIGVVFIIVAIVNLFLMWSGRGHITVGEMD